MEAQQDVVAEEATGASVAIAEWMEIFEEAMKAGCENNGVGRVSLVLGC